MLEKGSPCVLLDEMGQSGHAETHLDRDVFKRQSLCVVLPDKLKSFSDYSIRGTVAEKVNVVHEII
jgi:hypothetical protein